MKKITVTGYDHGIYVVPACPETGKKPGTTAILKDLVPGDVVYIRNQYGWRQGCVEENKRIARILENSGPHHKGNVHSLGAHSFVGEVILDASDLGSAVWERHRQILEIAERLQVAIESDTK
jgi:hypothetical protein